MKKTYHCQILYGRLNRRGTLYTTINDNQTNFAAYDNKTGKKIATRNATTNTNEHIAIKRLAKALNGMSYIYIIKVFYETRTKERYFKINN